jgi:predicted amidohydrolase YtcJ
VVSGGSDWSVSSLAPLDGMQVAITRRLPSDSAATRPWLAEEVVDLPTAIAMYTINAAYQNHQDRETGSVEVGKLADLVVLEKNLFDLPPRDIHAVRVTRTILEGRTVFEWNGNDR